MKQAPPNGTALCHQHINLPQLRDDLLGAMSLLGVFSDFLSEPIISISLV